MRRAAVSVANEIPQGDGEEPVGSRHQELLDPTRWDHLPLVGRGLRAWVFRAGRHAVKVAYPGHTLREEIEISALLAGADLPFEVPRFFASRPDGRALLRAFVEGAMVSELLVSGHAPATSGATQEERRLAFERLPWLDALARTVDTALRLERTHGWRLDVTPANLLLDDAGRLVLFDLGPRAAPPLFTASDTASLIAVLKGYETWRARAVPAWRPMPTLLPPSGRFHVETATGRPDGARLFFVNDAALVRTRLALPKDVLRELTCQSTNAPLCDRRFPSTRYQDTPTAGANQAKGDGRAILVGDVGGRVLSLKGCGPTALAWVGNRFHEDGLVSFPRTLWETAVSDELARLGFDVPEVLAVGDACATTVDNTERAWPAATALRAATTFFRVGHVVLTSANRDELRAMTGFIGRTTLRSDFSVDKVTHVRALIMRFARRLGGFVGETDGLNIQGFNPTMGNVRIDGPLIDYSTVRFMRQHAPDFVYMNGARRVREHMSANRGHVDLLVRTLWPLVGERHREPMWRAARQAYAQAYEEGMLASLARYLGLSREDVRDLPRHVVKNLVTDWRAIRGVRGGRRVIYTFFEVETRASAFDLEGRLPHFVDAVRAQARDPWRALLSLDDGAPVPRRAHATGAQLTRSFRMLLERVGAKEPRTWSGIVRPFVEVEALSDLCYRRSHPEKHAGFERLLASSLALEPGDYDARTAATRAKERRHVRSPAFDKGSWREAVVVGLHQRLQEGIVSLAADVFEDMLVLVAATGDRIVVEGDASSAHTRIVERGADHARTTPLMLHVVIERAGSREDADFCTPSTAAIGERIAAMSPLMPIDTRFHVVEPEDPIRTFARLSNRVALLHARNGLPRMLSHTNVTHPARARRQRVRRLVP